MVGVSLLAEGIHLLPWEPLDALRDTRGED